ncbi:unnamed protein product, partial [Prorocentrum cordatum]
GGSSPAPAPTRVARPRGRARAGRGAMRSGRAGEEAERRKKGAGAQAGRSNAEETQLLCSWSRLTFAESSGATSQAVDNTAARQRRQQFSSWLHNQAACHGVALGAEAQVVKPGLVQGVKEPSDTSTAASDGSSQQGSKKAASHEVAAAVADAPAAASDGGSQHGFKKAASCEVAPVVVDAPNAVGDCRGQQGSMGAVVSHGAAAVGAAATTSACAASASRGGGASSGDGGSTSPTTQTELLGGGAKGPANGFSRGSRATGRGTPTRDRGRRIGGSRTRSGSGCEARRAPFMWMARRSRARPRPRGRCDWSSSSLLRLLPRLLVLSSCSFALLHPARSPPTSP